MQPCYSRLGEEHNKEDLSGGTSLLSNQISMIHLNGVGKEMKKKTGNRCGHYSQLYRKCVWNLNDVDVNRGVIVQGVYVQCINFMFLCCRSIGEAIAHPCGNE